jgi:hypothetical protein
MKESRTHLKQPLLKLMDQECIHTGCNKEFKLMGIDGFRNRGCTDGMAPK